MVRNLAPWCVGLLLLGCGHLLAAERPNIVLIFSDDHAYQAISAYGDARRLVQTPQIDRLAAEGIRFNRCLVPNSICGPSRATVLTGKYSHLNGFYNNTNCRFDGSQTTFPKLLQAAGYQTALIGKWHLVSDPTGFDHWHILPGQGVYYNPPMIRNGQKVQHQGYVTDLISDLSIEWLKQRDKSKPFLLMSQHKAPHREWAPALRHLGHDGDRQYPEPPTLFDDYAGRGLAVRDQDMTLAKTMTSLDLKLTVPAQLSAEQRQAWDAYYDPRNEAFRQANPQGQDLIRWRYQRYMHDYLGCIQAVDEAVGKLLSFLDQEGLAENTVVVYASDQGFFLGEHGWFDKRWIFEESLRTPLLVRWPGVARPGTADEHLVSVLDFAPTFLEAAGIAVPPEIQGRSLVPLLRGDEAANWRKSFYYHYYEYPEPHRVRPHEGVVTDRHKLVHFYHPDVDYWELFDRQKDPHELRSCYDAPEYADVVRELRAELTRLRAELRVPDDSPATAFGARSSNTGRRPPRKPNIVYILCDDLGYGDVSCLNPQSKIVTPHMDRLAREGLVFTDMHTGSSVCTPTRYGILTGRYAWRSKLPRGVLGGLSPRLIEPERMTVASLLQAQGYHTACIGKWHLGMDWVRWPEKDVSELSIETPAQVHNVDYSQPTRNGPNSVGFDYYFGISASLDMVPYTFIENDHVTAAPTAEKDFPMMLGSAAGRTRLGPAAPDFEAEQVLPTLTRKAIGYLEQRAEAAAIGQPFFLYLPLASPHTPIAPIIEWQGRSGLNYYADFVLQTDWSIGQVLETLDRLGLAEDTLVVVTSDNGCSPQADFPALAAEGHQPSHIFRGYKADIFEGGHRVPFLVRWPGRVPAGTRTDQLGCLADLLATCADLLGVELPGNAGEDSVSLLPAFLGTDKGPLREAVVHHSSNGSFAIRQGPWKLILCPGSGGWSEPRPGSPAEASLPSVQLYDLSQDIGEQVNLQAARPEVVLRLRSLLEKYVADGRSTPGARQLNQRHVEFTP